MDFSSIFGFKQQYSAEAIKEKFVKLFAINKGSLD